MERTSPQVGFQHMLGIDNLTRSFGEKQVLRGVSFTLKPGSITGIIGPGGEGKSTLMKIMGGVGRMDSGAIVDPDRICSQASLMFQEGALFDSLNVLDNVAFPIVNGRVPVANLRGHFRAEVVNKVAAILDRVGLTSAIYKMPGQLSGGMRRRVSLARTLIGKPRLLLLDDPTCGLDPVASSVIMELILELHRENSPTTVIVSQDLRRLLPIVDNIVALFDGKVRFLGTLAQLRDFDCPNVKKFVSCRFDIS